MPFEAEPYFTVELTATINAMNAQIASAAEEQTAVAEEINRGVHKIARAIDAVANQSRPSTSCMRSAVARKACWGNSKSEAALQGYRAYQALTVTAFCLRYKIVVAVNPHNAANISQ